MKRKFTLTVEIGDGKMVDIKWAIEPMVEPEMLASDPWAQAIVVLGAEVLMTLQAKFGMQFIAVGPVRGEQVV